MCLPRPLAVFVLAILTLQVRIQAEDEQGPEADLLKSVSHSVSAPCSVNGFDQYRREPDPGAPDSPSAGFRHFPLAMHMYTHWHRPRAATLTKYQRCAPEAFRPRGFGNLFARPCDSFRMEYSPHVLSDGHSQYGPSYLYRHPDPRCEHCDHTRR